jgi:hypothetical protein
VLKSLIDWLSKLLSNPAWLVVIGGVFTLLGGYFGSRVLVRDERKRQRQELIAAIQITRAELARNMTTITAKLHTRDVPPTAKLELYDESFRTVAPILARELPMTLFGWLGVVMDQVSRLRDVPGITGQPKLETDALKDVQDRAKIANRLLLRYLQERLNFDVPRLSPEGTDTVEQIETNLARLLFPSPPKWQFWKRRTAAARKR